MREKERKKKLLDFIKTLKVHTTLPTIPSEALNPCPFYSAQFFRGSKNSFVQLSFKNRYGEYICEKRLVTELERNGPLYNATCAVNKLGGILFQEKERERRGERWRQRRKKKGSSLACCIIYSNYAEFLILLQNGSHEARWDPIKIIRWKAIRKWNKFRDGPPSISNQGYKMQRYSRLFLATQNALENARLLRTFERFYANTSDDAWRALHRSHETREVEDSHGGLLKFHI